MSIKVTLDRTPLEIKRHFKAKGIGVWWKSARNLSQVSISQQDRLRDVADISRIIIPARISRVDLCKVTDSAIQQHIKPRMIFPGNVLDLRGIQASVPEIGEKGRLDWIAANEKRMESFYKTHAGTFQHITNLSRAYQSSIIEGIRLILKYVQKKWPGEEIRLVDAGVGSAYFLYNLLLRAQAEGRMVRASAIDISEEACEMAREVFQEKLGERVQIYRGNAAKLTQSLPIEHGSQHIVCFNYILQYAPIDEILIEANRALEQGGIILVTNFKPKENMRWNEFWTNVRASWDCGRNKRFGHGRLYELARYFMLFLKHPLQVIKFAIGIDRDVMEGNIPENPNKKELAALVKRYGFRLLEDISETHHFAAYQLIAEKVREV